MGGRGPHRLAESTGPPSTTFLALTFMETSGMVHVQNSTRTCCLAWEGGLKGWDKWEFLRWMGTRLAFSVFVGIADALVQGTSV